MPKETKADSTKTAARVNLCTQLILQGYTSIQFLHDPQILEWGVGERQIQHYVWKAQKRLIALWDGEAAATVAFHKHARRQLYGKALAVGDLPTALAALREEANLLGLYPESRLTVTVSVR
jgi:hypothetical protein